ncbi:MAG: VWA domain-containing protein [Kiritimatiellae bacterium]|nr:VWA domain-containing protein [Kiritimatiellia bacterium]
MQWGSIETLHFLWLLIPLSWISFYLIKRRKKQLSMLIDLEVVPVMVPCRKERSVRTKNIIWLTALALCFVALARPQWGFHFEEVRRRGMNMLIVLDTSKSMLAEDIKPSRLQQAKWAIRDLVKQLQGDRIGLIPFAGGSFLQCPLTIDYAAFLMTLDDVYAGIIPRGGTAIAQALKKAIESFEESRSSDQAIILITDGEDHEALSSSLINELKKERIKVFIVGVGTLEGELIPIKADHGGLAFLKNRRGEVVKTALQEGPLEELAVETGGIYVRSVPGDFGLDRIVEQGLSHLKRDEQESQTIKAYEERFLWFLIPAFILLLLETTLSERVRKTKKSLRI